MTNKRIFVALPLALAAGALAAWLSLADSWGVVTIAFPNTTQGAIKTPLPVTKHIGLVLQHSDILRLNGIKSRFSEPFSSTPGEGVSADDVDVLLAGEIGSGNKQKFIFEGFDGVLTAYLGVSGAMGLITRPESGIQSLDDLRGKTIATMFDNALHRWLIDTLRNAGIGEGEVQFTRLIPRASVFDENVAAVAVWDPIFSIFRHKYNYISLAEGTLHAGVFMRRSFLEKRRDEALRVLIAIHQATDFWTKNRSIVHHVWARDTQPPIPLMLGDLLLKRNHLYRAGGMPGLDLSIEDEYVQALRSDAAFLFKRGVLQQEVDLKALIDHRLVKQAQGLARPLSTAEVAFNQQ